MIQYCNTNDLRSPFPPPTTLYNKIVLAFTATTFSRGAQVIVIASFIELQSIFDVGERRGYTPDRFILRSTFFFCMAFFLHLKRSCSLFVGGAGFVLFGTSELSIYGVMG